MSGTCHFHWDLHFIDKNFSAGISKQDFFPSENFSGNTTEIFLLPGFSPGFVMRFFAPYPGEKGIPGRIPTRIHDGNFLPTGKFSYRRDFGRIPVGMGFLAGSRQDPRGYFTRETPPWTGARCLLSMRHQMTHARQLQIDQFPVTRRNNCVHWKTQQLITHDWS